MENNQEPQGFFDKQKNIDKMLKVFLTNPTTNRS